MRETKFMLRLYVNIWPCLNDRETILTLNHPLELWNFNHFRMMMTKSRIFHQKGAMLRPQLMPWGNNTNWLTFSKRSKRIDMLEWLPEISFKIHHSPSKSDKSIDFRVFLSRLQYCVWIYEEEKFFSPNPYHI
jgi:hypothetical protein